MFSSMTKTRSLSRALARLKSARSGDVSVQRGNSGGGQLAHGRERGMRGRDRDGGFNDMLGPFSPLVEAFVPPMMRPDRVFDAMSAFMPREMRSMMRGVSPRDIERDVARGLEETVGLSQIKLDIAESKDAYTIHAEVPGVGRDNLKVEVDEDSGMLTISAEKSVGPLQAQAQGQGQQGAASGAGKEGAEGSGGREQTWLRAERHFGRIERSLSLPADADYERVGAKLDQGVLTLTLPRRAGSHEEHGRRQVEIA